MKYLRFFGGLSFKEIGKIMDKSGNWAKANFLEEHLNNCTYYKEVLYMKMGSLFI
ncbi:hypothetical protein [Clostridium sp. Cult3]|uniref:hypothetical protein n=1 Tax=Clostridium sp. Cult3 TaxID=2079004 RepID=UPI001F28DDE4|nr:hypothetical protein [Clostridium sp. Cult3]